MEEKQDREIIHGSPDNLEFQRVEVPDFMWIDDLRDLLPHDREQEGIPTGQFVTGVLFRGNNVLFITSKDYLDLPGGKQNPGEYNSTTLRREGLEEMEAEFLLDYGLPIVGVYLGKIKGDNDRYFGLWEMVLDHAQVVKVIGNPDGVQVKLPPVPDVEDDSSEQLFQAILRYGVAIYREGLKLGRPWRFPEQAWFIALIKFIDYFKKTEDALMLNNFALVAFEGRKVLLIKIDEEVYGFYIPKASFDGDEVVREITVMQYFRVPKESPFDMLVGGDNIRVGDELYLDYGDRIDPVELQIPPPILPTKEGPLICESCYPIMLVRLKERFEIVNDTQWGNMMLKLVLWWMELFDVFGDDGRNPLLLGKSPRLLQRIELYRKYLYAHSRVVDYDKLSPESIAVELQNIQKDINNLPDNSLFELVLCILALSAVIMKRQFDETLTELGVVEELEVDLEELGPSDRDFDSSWVFFLTHKEFVIEVLDEFFRRTLKNDDFYGKFLGFIYNEISRAYQFGNKEKSLLSDNSTSLLARARFLEMISQINLAIWKGLYITDIELDRGELDLLTSLYFRIRRRLVSWLLSQFKVNKLSVETLFSSMPSVFSGFWGDPVLMHEVSRYARSWKNRLNVNSFPCN